MLLWYCVIVGVVWIFWLICWLLFVCVWDWYVGCDVVDVGWDGRDFDLGVVWLFCLFGCDWWEVVRLFELV